MKITVFLDDLQLQSEQFKVENKEGKRKISFEFQVTSESYHDVTAKLYENKFQLKVPEEDINCKVTIFNYFTSITNLYEEGAVGDYYLELVEING